MELAKVTSKGQVTIPVSIRKRMGIKDGDKLLFIEKPGGVVMMNPTLMALEKIGRAFEGEAERLGLENEDDVVAMIKEIRRERWEKNYADNA
ncbi:MAG: AbrB/MazE/SpoVT family DNA-binding domain-containing protein [Oscillospiraceae bacterium]|nr:AbrB/MazE/SpoVT family DNA-binding domain-containing protein [Oscillospiraceae bacterium]